MCMTVFHWKNSSTYGPAFLEGSEKPDSTGTPHGVVLHLSVSFICLTAPTPPASRELINNVRQPGQANSPSRPSKAWWEGRERFPAPDLHYGSDVSNERVKHAAHSSIITRVHVIIISTAQCD